MTHVNDGGAPAMLSWFENLESGMTRYFYDFDDVSDDTGLEMASDRDAVSAAWQELPQMVSALDETRRLNNVYLVVRRECGRTIARLEVQVKATVADLSAESALFPSATKTDKAE